MLGKLIALEGLPQLDEVYEQIHQKNTSGPNERMIAELAYKWLLYCCLPMSTSNLSDAALVETNTLRLKSINLRHLCCNLLEFSDTSDVVQFAHPTVRDYLAGAKGEKEIMTYSAIECHKQIAMTCLAALNDATFPEISGDSLQGASWDFRTYAAMFWTFHLSEVSEDAMDNRLRDMVVRVLLRKQGRMVFQPWMESWFKIYCEECLRAKAPKNAITDKKSRFVIRFPEMYKLVVSTLTSPPDPFFTGCIFGIPALCTESRLSLKE